MTFYELIQELAQYEPDIEVVVEVIGNQVRGEMDSVSSDGLEGCMSFDKISDSFDVIPNERENKAAIEVNI